MSRAHDLRFPRPISSSLPFLTIADGVTIIILLSLSWLLPGFLLPASTSGGPLRISSAEGSQTHSVRQDRVVTVQGPLGATEVRILDGEVFISQAPCPNKLCQKMGKISGPGRALVCIPNRVRLQFASPRTDVDAVTQ